MSPSRSSAKLSGGSTVRGEGAVATAGESGGAGDRSGDAPSRDAASAVRPWSGRSATRATTSRDAMTVIGGMSDLPVEGMMTSWF
jgi:hypothetical protein